MTKATAKPAPVIEDDVNETIPLIPEDILRQHHCLEPDASRFTAAARLLQSLWRQDQNLPVGHHRSPSGETRQIGSRLTMSAGRAGANFLDPAIASLVRRELVYREIGALIDADRLFRNLLSSCRWSSISSDRSNAIWSLRPVSCGSSCRASLKP